MAPRCSESPFLIFGAAAPIFRLAPVWHQAYAPSVIIILAGTVQAGINLVRPDWIRFRSAARLGVGAITLGVVYFLIRAGEWVVLANPAGNARAPMATQWRSSTNPFFTLCCYPALFIVVLLLLRDLSSLIHIPHRLAA